MNARRLVVTGGAGFIGSQFIRAWLARHPTDEVVNLDVLTYAGSRERLADLEGSHGYWFIQGDICEAQAAAQALQGAQIIVHFAAETHVDRSIENASPFLRTNVEGTAVLLEAARAARVERFVHVSTDEVYGPIAEGAADERAPLAPRSPYAASKAAADLLVRAFHQTHSLPVVIVRPTNLFGPAQFPEKLIPLAITNALTDVPVPVYGDGQHRRGWLFVEDACEAIGLLAERGQVGEIYNVGSGHEQANADTVRMILALTGRPADLLRFVADRPAHDRRYALQDEKIQALGWRPRTPFDEGLKRTVAWYREHDAWWRPLVQKLRADPYHWLNRPTGSSARPALGASR